MSAICLFCEKNDNLSPVRDDLVVKLQNLVPELDWNINFQLCQICVQRLNSTYEFRNVCVVSYKKWKLLSGQISRLVDSEPCCKNDINTDSAASNCSDAEKEHSTVENRRGGCLKRMRQKIETCENCGKTFLKNRLKKHLISCFKKNASQENVNDSTTKNILVLPTCELCGTSFSNKSLLKRHVRNVHASEKKFKCELCNSAFVSLVYLNAHKRYHSGKRSHICSFCGKGFITASDLCHHEKIHANKRSYRCEKCPKAFNTSSDLHKHKICVHLDRSKWKYVCSYCEKRFPLKTNLDSHLKTHTGEKNYVCPVCDRKCINKSVLMRHIGTHSNIVAFKCDFCLQGYKYKRSLRLHLSKVHGIGDSKYGERLKKFSCQVCPKTYYNDQKLQKHVKTHNSVAHIILQNPLEGQI